MLLLFPPVAKPCEPPAGVARLAGVLRGNGQRCTVIDLNLAGLDFLLNLPVDASDTWSRRAVKNSADNLASFRGPELYINRDRYGRAVADLNRVLALVGDPTREISLANYTDSELSPHQSVDLIRAFNNPEENIFFPLFRDQLTGELTENNYALIGISLNYLSQAQVAFALAGFIKKIAPDLKIVMGGGLVTSWLSRPDWSNPFGEIIDQMVAGAGEPYLLNEAGIPAGSCNHPPDYTDLASLPYLAPGLILPYAASTGCYWNRCRFCPEQAEQNPYHPIPTSQVLGDLDLLCRKHRPILIHFLDNAVSPALMRGLIEHPLGVDWYGFARVSRELIDPAFCADLARSGCRMLKLGIESGNQQVLDRMDKGIDLAQVAQALSSLHQAGIATYVYLLFGTPHETLVEARETMAFTVRHHRTITYLNLAIFNLPLGSPEAEELEIDGLLAGDLSLYANFIHPKGWNRADVRHFLDREFKRQPEIATILQRDPPLFTSNHAPFFLKTLS
ncbi:MAG: radical SAM protein [Proteobacteria bacterium]|nr:radical SAM protein [Pseudomonadota bacterium]MBU1686773.1 radical SAM protein [Pseudomonadota bacterium]